MYLLIRYIYIVHKLKIYNPKKERQIKYNLCEDLWTPEIFKGKSLKRKKYSINQSIYYITVVLSYLNHNYKYITKDWFGRTAAIPKPAGRLD